MWLLFSCSRRNDGAYRQYWLKAIDRLNKIYYNKFDIYRFVLGEIK